MKYYHSVLTKLKQNLQYLYSWIGIKRNVISPEQMIYGISYYQGNLSNYENVTIPDSFLAKYYINPRLKYLKTHIGNLAGKRILDIGCGFGVFLLCCKNLHADVYGFDISDPAYRAAKKKIGVSRIKKYDGQKNNYPFKQNTFDLICAFDTVEHLNKPDVFFHNVYRLLKRGGYLYLITPNGVQKTDHDKTHINVHHCSYWTQHAIGCGFQTLDSYCYSWYPPTPYLFLQQVRHFINRQRGYCIEQFVLLSQKL